MQQHNFDRNQKGMKLQLQNLRALVQFVDPKLFDSLLEKDASNLYFCFRWLLIRFKREFTFENIQTLWEVGERIERSEQDKGKQSEESYEKKTFSRFFDTDQRSDLAFGNLNCFPFFCEKSRDCLLYSCKCCTLTWLRAPKCKF